MTAVGRGFAARSSFRWRSGTAARQSRWRRKATRESRRPILRWISRKCRWWLSIRSAGSATFVKCRRRAILNRRRRPSIGPCLSRSQDFRWSRSTMSNRSGRRPTSATSGAHGKAASMAGRFASKRRLTKVGCITSRSSCRGTRLRASSRATSSPKNRWLRASLSGSSSLDWSPPFFSPIGT